MVHYVDPRMSSYASTACAKSTKRRRYTNDPTRVTCPWCWDSKAFRALGEVRLRPNPQAGVR